MTEKKLRILIADDYDIVREGARAVIERQLGWEVCGLARTGREAVELATSTLPDVVIMDMTMPELNGLDAARQIKRHLPETEIIMFTAHVTDDLIRRAFETGVKSFLNKTEAHQHLVDAIESVSRHKPYFTTTVSEILFADIVRRAERTRPETQPGERLTGREREIVQMLAEGRSNKEVAEALGISLRTVETHRATIMRKLGVDSIAGLVRYAIRNKMVEP